jgi:hypothetical protein
MDIDWAVPQWTLVGNVLAMILLAAFDKLLAPPQARWFAIHAFGNLLAVISAVPAVLATLADPAESMSSIKYNDSSFFGTGTPWPILIVNAIHIYHMVAFKLSSADYFHHLVFALTMGSAGQLYRLGAFRGFLVFWLSGLPGGIDYFNLVLVKFGKLDGLTQKRHGAAINVWIRGPFLVTSGFIIYLNYCYHGQDEGIGYPPMFVSAFIAFLCVFNAQYYTKQSVANHAIAHVLGHVKTRISVITGNETTDWKSIMSSPRAKEPQNSMS